MKAPLPLTGASLSYKKAAIIIVAGATYLVGQYFMRYTESIDALGWPLITLGQMLAIIWFIIWLAGEKTYRLWLKVSAVYIPIAVILSFVIYPIRFAPDTPIAPVSYGIYPFGALYIIITLAVVLIGWWRSRSREPASA